MVRTESKKRRRRLSSSTEEVKEEVEGLNDVEEQEDDRTWDATHNDPTLDIRIRSRDNTLFSISSFRLGKARSVY